MKKVTLDMKLRTGDYIMAEIDSNAPELGAIVDALDAGLHPVNNRPDCGFTFNRWWWSDCNDGDDLIRCIDMLCKVLHLSDDPIVRGKAADLLIANYPSQDKVLLAVEKILPGYALVYAS